MKYAIYDKAADGYLTKMECITDIPDTALGLQCEYNEYITEAKLLDTPKEAADAIVRIESFKFMEKGRFVIHSFDETLLDQYIISEAGNPTKVVDNITVDLSGTIDVKYGTMPLHWSTPCLMRAIARLDALQKAASDVYTTWRDTFDIYKVFTVIDERSCGHYQFVNVTEKCLDFAKEEAEPLNKRIEELERANYELGEQVVERGCVANRLQEENDNLKTKVESIKEEARNWKKLYENADADKEEFKNVIDVIYDDLKSETICDDLKDTLKALSHNSGLDHIFMPIKTSYVLDKGNCLTAKDEIYYIVNQIITILESRELNQSVAFSSAEEVASAKKLANDIIDICEATTDPFEVTLKKFSQLYEAVNDPSDDDDTIMYAFKGVLEIFSSLEDNIRGIIDESVTWKHKAMKAEKALDNQKKLNEANTATIVRYRNERRNMDKENHELRTARDCSAEIIYAIRNAICGGRHDAFDCIKSRMNHDTDFNSNPFMAGVRENIKDICSAEEKNIANHELKNDEIAKLSEKIEKLKSQFNSMYGYYDTDDAAIDYCLHDVMITGGRCCGKQLMADILNGKKIPISKDKYDSILTSLKLIDLSYEDVYGTTIRISPKPKPTWLSGLMMEIENLTK